MLNLTNGLLNIMLLLLLFSKQHQGLLQVMWTIDNGCWCSNVVLSPSPFDWKSIGPRDVRAFNLWWFSFRAKGNVELPKFDVLKRRQACFFYSTAFGWTPMTWQRSCTLLVITQSKEALGLCCIKQKLTSLCLTVLSLILKNECTKRSR